MESRPGDPVAIGMGSNLGDRVAHLRFALRGLRDILDHVRVSRVYETEPMDREDQPPFLNACCTGTTRLTPRQLLSELQRLERQAGRRAEGIRYGPRPLDLDLLLYGGRTIEEPDLVVPHARLPERAFVLVPLAEIAPGLEVPASPTASTVADLASSLPTSGVVRTPISLEDS